MASKLENIIYKTYKGGAGEDDKDRDEDTSTVDTDTSDIMKRLEDDDDDDEGSVAMNSDDEADQEAGDDADVAEDSDVEDDESEDEDDGEQGAATTSKKTNTTAAKSKPTSSEISEDDDDDDDEDYLQKLDDSVRKSIIGEYHPEMIQHNDEEVETLCKIVRDADGVIIDPFHKTLPFVTKYEKARILGERAKQINAGAKPFIAVEKHIIDGYLIALREFEEKKIPFIVRRPLPNGGSEYWKLADLQILD